MKIYKTQQEVEKDIKDEVLLINGDVKFGCSISVNASIKVNAGNITALDINALDINAGDINAWNINAGDINARNINARNILYYAFCGAYNSIKCLSIKAKREKHSEPVCLDGNLEIKQETKNPKEIIIGGATYVLKD